MCPVVGTEDIRRLVPAAVRVVAVAAVYYGAARLGLLEQVRVDAAVVTPFYPATGIAVSALLLFGLRIWPGILIGVVLVINALGPFSPYVFWILAGNTLAPVCSFLMLRRAGFRLGLDRFRDALALVFLGALGGMLISATTGAMSLVLTGNLPVSKFWPVFTSWWAGDATGVLVVTPVLLALHGFRKRAMPRHRWAEAAVLAIATVLVSLLVTRGTESLLFLVFPLLIWAPLRFQLAGGAPCALIVSVLAVSAATDQVGSFAHLSLVHGMVVLQAFNGCVALTTLLLAAMVTEQLTIRRKIEQACLDLAEVVDHLAPGAARKAWPLPGGERSGGRSSERRAPGPGT